MATERLVESQNEHVDLEVKATSFMGFNQYGMASVGDKAFEFYDDQNPKNFAQIPWTEVKTVRVSLLFGGRWIPRIAFETKRNGTYMFAVKRPRKVIRAIHKYLPREQFATARSFSQIVKTGVKADIKKLKQRKNK